MRLWDHFRAPCSQKEEAVPALPQGPASHPLLLLLALVFAELPWADVAQKTAFPFQFPLLFNWVLAAAVVESIYVKVEGARGKQGLHQQIVLWVFPWIRLFIPHALPNPWPISKYLNAICNECIQKNLNYLDNMLLFSKGTKNAPHFWQLNLLEMPWFIDIIELSATWVPAEHEDHRKIPKLIQI